MTAKNKISDFRKELVSGFWKYQQKYFKDWENYFERPISTDGRPPVFLKPIIIRKKEANYCSVFKLGAEYQPNAYPEVRIYHFQGGYGKYTWGISVKNSQFSILNDVPLKPLKYQVILI